MPQTFLLRGANQLLTLRGPAGPRRGAALSDVGLIPDGSMLIRDGVVLCVGQSRRIENLKIAKTAIEIPVYGKVVMPGLVDSSLHLSLRRSQGLHKLKRVADFHDDSLSLLRSCLQHGTVAAEVHASADARDFHADIAVLRKLVKIGSNPVHITRTWRIGRDEDFALDPDNPEDRRITFDTLLRRNFIDAVSVAPRQPNDFDLELLAAAQAAGLSLKMSWSGGDLAVFRALIDQLNPHSVSFTGTPTPEEGAVLAPTATIAVLAAGKQVFEGAKGT